jgi:hypothetical protein
VFANSGAGGAVSAELRALIPETTYYFRLVSTRNNTTLRGEIRSFVSAKALQW